MIGWKALPLKVTETHIQIIKRIHIVEKFRKTLHSRLTHPIAALSTYKLENNDVKMSVAKVLSYNYSHSIEIYPDFDNCTDSH